MKKNQTINTDLINFRAFMEKDCEPDANNRSVPLID